MMTGIVKTLEARLTPSGLLFLLAAAVLGSVYLAEHGFGMEPCALCLYQRWPWWVALGLGAVGLALRPRAMAGRVLVGAIAVSLLAGLAVAGYHVGVEQGFWQGPTACAQPGSLDMSLDDLRAQVMGRERVVPCDQPAYILGVSMASWNLVVTLWALIYVGSVLGGRTR